MHAVNNGQGDFSEGHHYATLKKKKNSISPPHCESECMNHGDAGVLSVGEGIFS